MSMITPALLVDVYSIHSSEKKKAYPFCRICSLYAMHIIKSHRFHTFGVKYIHLVKEMSLGLYTFHVPDT